MKHINFFIFLVFIIQFTAIQWGAALRIRQYLSKRSAENYNNILPEANGENEMFHSFLQLKANANLQQVPATVISSGVGNALSTAGNAIVTPTVDTKKNPETKVTEVLSPASSSVTATSATLEAISPNILTSGILKNESENKKDNSDVDENEKESNTSETEDNAASEKNEIEESDEKQSLNTTSIASNTTNASTPIETQTKNITQRFPPISPALNTTKEVGTSLPVNATAISNNNNTISDAKLNSVIADTSKRLGRVALVKKEAEKSKEHWEAAKEKDSVKLKKAQKSMIDKVGWVADRIHNLTEEMAELKGETVNVEERFLKDINYATMAEEDIPVALARSTPMIPGSADCPIHCDPAVCDNIESELTQCFKVNLPKPGSTEEKKHVCKPFEDENKLICPQGFKRCGAAVFKHGKKFKINVSTPKDPIYQPLLIKGKNLHQCLRILFLPTSVPCTVENAPQMMAVTTSIMGSTGSSAYPEITEDKKPKAKFPKLQILLPGKYQLCIVQFAKTKEVKPIGKIDHSSDLTILEANTIGTVIGILPKTNKTLVTIPTNSSISPTITTTNITTPLVTATTTPIQTSRL